MKRLFLVALSLYCVGSGNVAVAGIGSDLRNINRTVCDAVEHSLYNGNLRTSFAALFTHNILLKKSSNLIDLKDQQMVVCLTGGWVGDAISKLSYIKDLPKLVQVPFKHPFATSWLAYNLIVNRNNIMKDWTNLVVGGYLVLNAFNECN